MLNMWETLAERNLQPLKITLVIIFYLLDNSLYITVCEAGVGGEAEAVAKKLAADTVVGLERAGTGDVEVLLFGVEGVVGINGL